MINLHITPQFYLEIGSITQITVGPSNSPTFQGLNFLNKGNLDVKKVKDFILTQTEMFGFPKDNVM